MGQLIIRFLVGGAIVSAFALLGDVLHPKGFAGLFAAAPSVALATLTLTVASEGPGYAALSVSGALVLALVSWLAISSLLWYVRKRHPWKRPTRSKPATR